MPNICDNSPRKRGQFGGVTATKDGIFPYSMVHMPSQGYEGGTILSGSRDTDLGSNGIGYDPDDKGGYALYQLLIVRLMRID